MEQGFIYRITCNTTGKKYIGQAREFKHKNGKPYKYGIPGRWSDHMSSAKAGATKPLSEAIRQFGANDFKLEEITKATLTELDALEAQWIEREGTLIPNGYNICKHSRNRHRTTSSLSAFYQGKVEDAILRPIRQDGQWKMVYVMLNMKDGNVERIAFGQKQNQSHEEAKAEARQFLNELGCPFREETTNSHNPLERYASKLAMFANKRITKIRITSASSLVAVYVTTADAKSYKDQIRICFGGKVIPAEVAYEIAKLFVRELPKNESTILEDHYQCPQQAAALEGEATPSGENSVIASRGSVSSQLNL
jgi:hypothetical protein